MVIMDNRCHGLGFVPEFSIVDVGRRDSLDLEVDKNMNRNGVGNCCRWLILCLGCCVIEVRSSYVQLLMMLIHTQSCSY